MSVACRVYALRDARSSLALCYCNFASTLPVFVVIQLWLARSKTVAVVRCIINVAMTALGSRGYNHDLSK